MTIPALGTPVYDPRLFTPEQEARIAEMIQAAIEQAAPRPISEFVVSSGSLVDWLVASSESLLRPLQRSEQPSKTPPQGE